MFFYNQSLRLFRYYNHYRVVISLILSGVVFFPGGATTLFYNTAFYQMASLCYLGINVFIAFLLLAGFQAKPRHIGASFAFDLIALHSMMYFSTGTSGGLGNLVVISIAATNILIQGRLGYLYAAVAAIGTLGTNMMLYLSTDKATAGPVEAGMLGIVYFASAIILQNVAKRLRLSEQLAQSRAQNIAELEKLNHQIIQRMQTGILVTDEYGHVRLSNQAADQQLNQDKILELPKPLKDRLSLWRTNTAIRTTPFSVSSASPTVQANFTKLQKDGGADILIFLEDTSKIAQQAQQMKLASLGRLTASIAHEIRNPLGAISHASELLGESADLTAPDHKMTEIIARHCRRVNNIIENIFMLSRRTEPSVEEIILNDWLADFIEEYKQGCEAPPNIEYRPFDQSLSAQFDPSQIEQVLTNLFANGLRYSRKNTGEARLVVKTAQNHRNELAYIDIIDFGSGVPSENIEHLFEPFFTTEGNGTGLGLYLSRELCEANQAQLSYINQTGQGACFRVTFAHHKRII